jgi:hypothetical protein
MLLPIPGRGKTPIAISESLRRICIGASIATWVAFMTLILKGKN